MTAVALTRQYHPHSIVVNEPTSAGELFWMHLSVVMETTIEGETYFGAELICSDCDDCSLGSSRFNLEERNRWMMGGLLVEEDDTSGIVGSVCIRIWW